MTKSELISKLVMRLPHLSARDVHNGVGVMIEKISGTLAEGGRVEVRGFGSFSVRHWGRRHARNPTTGLTWRTPPMSAAHFKAGGELRHRVNKRYLKEQTAKAEARRKKSRLLKPFLLIWRRLKKLRLRQYRLLSQGSPSSLMPW